MSTGGVFTIIANDGKADKMIMATDLLRQRIEQVKCARRAANAKGLPGYEDDTPTLVDIERSHILYVNAHFKPFAAIGYEYQKIAPQQGLANFSSSAQVVYSIPQFGDFFYDMVLNINVPAITSTPQVAIGTNAAVQAAATYSNVLNVNNRTIVHSFFTDPAGNVLYDPHNQINVLTPRSDFVRYCEFPAMRTVTSVQFTVNGNPLDQYDSNSYVYYEQFRVRPGKRVGWNRSVGQQVPLEGYSNLQVPNNNVVDGSPQLTDAVATGAPYSQILYSVVDGAQTPQPTQPIQDWYLKLLLWFNEDVRLSVPSVSIPYGQRFIVVSFANITDVVFTSGAGLILTTQTTVINYTGAGATDTATDVTETVTRQPFTLGSTIPTLSGFNRAELYINNIFVNPEIHDVYIKRIGFNLIRVHRIQKTSVSTPALNILLSQLKWPVEYFFVGIRPLENEQAGVSANSSFIWRNWHRFTQAIPRNITMATTVSNLTLPQTGINPQTHNTIVNYSGGDNSVQYWDEYATIDTVEVSAHQIPIYKVTPSAFFNNHIPFQFGGVNIQTPSDAGALLVNFCLYPGTYQPSGHFNISRAREFYFNYTSSLITNNYTGNMYCEASALNFLLISDGSAVLRYST